MPSAVAKINNNNQAPNHHQVLLAEAFDKKSSEVAPALGAPETKPAVPDEPTPTPQQVVPAENKANEVTIVIVYDPHNEEHEILLIQHKHR